MIINTNCHALARSFCLYGTKKSSANATIRSLDLHSAFNNDIGLFTIKYKIPFCSCSQQSDTRLRVGKYDGNTIKEGRHTTCIHRHKQQDHIQTQHLIQSTCLTKGMK